MATEKETPKAKKVSSAIDMSAGVKELERLFTLMNRKFYGGKLLKPIITVQSAGRMKAYGWFCGNLWTVKKDQVPEINLCAEWMKRSTDEVMVTLLHEMVHLDNWQNDIKDCAATQYHNKKFKEAAEKVGFEVEKMGRFGYAKTNLTPSLKKIFATMKPDSEVLGIFRGELAKRGSKGSKLKKWTCGCTNVRCATTLEAHCNACNKPFKCVDPTSDDFEGGDDE